MSRSLKALGLAVPASLLVAAPALAQSASSWWWWPRPVRNVPEIDASSGLLAIAAVAAILALVVERRRRA
ncbi:VPEID-CTERM sorting domain-containing protein [Neotabrizicola shimadae]|nr:VPEID-CTERM sorting domain-containing protein [Neotabrizicola shimadae]